VRVEGAPADEKLYNNLMWGPMQGTGGSTALANSFDQYRQAGAAARAMLVSAAAQKWNVAPESIRVKDGVVTHANGKKATFGELADAAAKMPVPQSVKLKEASDYVYIGKSFARPDSKAKATGTATFTQDVKLPDMLTAVVAHPPRYGGTVKSFKAESIQASPGVRYVVEVPNGVAIVATNFWSAKKGRDALAIEWDDSGALKGSSADILAEFKRLAAMPGKVARNDGDAAKAIAGAAKTIDATYEFPYLAHAAMEPMNCVVQLAADRCDVWNGEQFQTVDQGAVAKVVGLAPQQVFLHQIFAGGSFGRRANPQSDYLVEAASVAKALAAMGKGGAPIKLVWTREDDMKAGYFRPAYLHVMKAGLDASGNVVGWQHRIVGQSILTGNAVRSDDGQGRGRFDEHRGRCDAAVFDTQSDRRFALAENRRARAVVAFGGLFAQRLCDRSVHRRARDGGRQGSGRVSPGDAVESSEASGRVDARGRKSGMGNAASTRKGRR
jgi:isoquinoline 1-oxidoreductase beta subunit